MHVYYVCMPESKCICMYGCMYATMHVCIHVCRYVIFKLGFERYERNCTSWDGELSGGELSGGKCPSPRFRGAGLMRMYHEPLPVSRKP